MKQLLVIMVCLLCSSCRLFNKGHSEIYVINDSPKKIGVTWSLHNEFPSEYFMGYQYDTDAIISPGHKGHTHVYRPNTFEDIFKYRSDSLFLFVIDYSDLSQYVIYDEYEVHNYTVYGLVEEDLINVNWVLHYPNTDPSITTKQSSFHFYNKEE